MLQKMIFMHRDWKVGDTMQLFRKHRKMWKILGIIFLLLLLVNSVKLYWSNCTLKCSYYSIYSDKLTQSVRIVQLTDLHNQKFGSHNRKLVEKVKEQEPDVILLTGDLVNAGEVNTEIATELIASLKEVAPVYVSFGNHELEQQKNYETDLQSLYEEAGAVVLEKEYQDISLNGEEIRLGGIYGYCLPSKYLASNEANPKECAFLEEFQNTDRYKILMCHMPVCWMINGSLDEWDVDSIFAGHVHGGQVVLPKLGAVYGPDLGWFPGRLYGPFYSGDGESTMILSTGLGSNGWIPRWNNRSEIAITDLIPNE